MSAKGWQLKQEILKYIDDCYFKHGFTPSVQEIANHVGRAKSSVSVHLSRMEEDGLLENSSSSRGVKTKKIAKANSSGLLAPVVGTIACGTPLLAEENIESYIYLPEELIGHGDFFVLKAKGKSMINVGIDDGDLVIVRQQDSANDGQIVVARIDDEATLKRIHFNKRNHSVILHPENDSMSDMSFPKVDIQGVAIKVIKDII